MSEREMVAKAVRYIADMSEDPQGYQLPPEDAPLLRRAAALLTQERQPIQGMARVHPAYLAHLRKLEQKAIERGEANPTDWETEEREPDALDLMGKMSVSPTEHGLLVDVSDLTPHESYPQRWLLEPLEGDDGIWYHGGSGEAGPLVDLLVAIALTAGLGTPSTEDT